MKHPMTGFTEELRRLCLELMPRFIGTAHGTKGTKIKPDDTPVTSLDHFALQQFRAVLEDNFPDSRTIGEEDGMSADGVAKILRIEDEFQWSIDGLDGTWHYRAGTNSYGAAIALRHGSEVLYTAIFRPIDMALRRNGFFYAHQGYGAWEWCGCSLCNGTYRRMHTAAHNSERLVVLLEGSSKKFWATPVKNIGAVLTTRPSLSSCIAATTVARGALDARAIVTCDHKPWDGWPVALMIKEAGGIVTDHHGNPFSAENCGNLIAAANETDHARILRLLKQK